MICPITQKECWSVNSGEIDICSFGGNESLIKEDGEDELWGEAFQAIFIYGIKKAKDKFHITRKTPNQ